jgi:hypothetical protein
MRYALHLFWLRLETQLLVAQVDEVAEGVSEDEENKGKDPHDISGDKLIQAPKKRKTAHAGAGTAKSKVKQ